MCTNYIQIINGPNLNLLGQREPEIYGSRTLADLETWLQAQSDVELHFFQSNSEGALIDAIQSAGTDSRCRGIVLNAGAYTHYSYAIADAIAAVGAVVVEVHMSNIHSREPFRHKSVIASVCRGSISGFGRESYSLAVDYLSKLNGKN